MITQSTVTPNKSDGSKDTFGVFCDWGIVFSLCAGIFVLPASIAYLDSFTGLAIFFYLIKKINRIRIDWALGASHLNFGGKFHFVRKGFAPAGSFFNRPLQFFILAVFLAVVFSQYPVLSLFAFVGKLLKVVFLYFSFIEAFNDERRIWIFLSCLLLSAFIAALSGVCQEYTGRDFIKGHRFGYENLVVNKRVNSVFYSANGFGAYLLPVIGLLVHFVFTAIVRRKSWILASVFAVTLALLLACLCWTYSRSAWIGYVASLIVMCLMDWRKTPFAAGLMLIFVLAFLPSLNQVRNLNLVNDNSSGVKIKNVSLVNNIKPCMGDIGSGRMVYWKKAISIFRSSPIFGTGLNTYTKIIKRDPGLGAKWYAHNCYLQMAAETGIVGLAGFLWMVLVLLWHGFNHCKQINDPWSLSILQGALSGLSGLLVQSFFDNTFYSVQLGVLMWFIFSLIVAMTRLKLKN